MHLQEIERANMARRCFDKKLETKAADWRLHEDFITSIQPLGNARLQAERRRADAEQAFYRMLEAREHGAERPYRQSLQNYRSWQVSHPPPRPNRPPLLWGLRKRYNAFSVVISMSKVTDLFSRLLLLRIQPSPSRRRKSPFL